MSDTTKYLQAIEDRIDAINNCAALEEAAAEIQEALAGVLVDLQAQIDALAPLLIAPSANLAAIVAWITSLIATFTAPYNASLLELALINAKIASITAKLTSKIATLECEFTPPTIP